MVNVLEEKCTQLVTFLTKHEVSTHEAIKRVLSQPMRHSNIDVLFFLWVLKK